VRVLPLDVSVQVLLHLRVRTDSDETNARTNDRINK
jgi:hypothetical protein